MEPTIFVMSQDPRDLDEFDLGLPPNLGTLVSFVEGGTVRTVRDSEAERIIFSAHFTGNRAHLEWKDIALDPYGGNTLIACAFEKGDFYKAVEFLSRNLGVKMPRAVTLITTAPSSGGG